MDKFTCLVAFDCLEDGCGSVVSFDLMDAAAAESQILCPACHRPYELDDRLKEKLGKLFTLIRTIRDSEDILGDCAVSVTVPGGSVKIPYPLLLTRLNTLITLEMAGKKTQFYLRIEPGSSQTFK